MSYGDSRIQQATVDAKGATRGVTSRAVSQRISWTSQDPEVLEQWLTGDVKFRLLLVSMDSLSPTTMQRLARDENYSVRHAVAHNQKLPDDIRSLAGLTL